MPPQHPLGEEFPSQPDWTLVWPHPASPPARSPIVTIPHPPHEADQSCRERGVLIASVLYVSSMSQGIRPSTLLPVTCLPSSKTVLGKSLGNVLPPSTSESYEFKPCPCNWPSVPDPYKEPHWPKERGSDLQVCERARLQIRSV